MPKRRQIRRLAMQVLYQLDLRGQADAAAIQEGLAEGPDDAEVSGAAFTLAEAAWKTHGAADAIVAELAPKWPTHRQPPVDRAILRLAYHEMASGYSPPKVAINEAVELAKEFCSEQSPSFINGVLDKMAKKVAASTPVAAASENNDEAGEPGGDAKETKPSTGDAWLGDALEEG